MCNSGREDGEGCPHFVEIPLLLLRSATKITVCQICHVLFAAIEPFMVSVEESLLANLVLKAYEGLAFGGTVDVFSREHEVCKGTRILPHVWDFESRTRYGAMLSRPEDK
jgi:hypothetical protein